MNRRCWFALFAAALGCFGRDGARAEPNSQDFPNLFWDVIDRRVQVEYAMSWASRMDKDSDTVDYPALRADIERRTARGLGK